MSIELEDDAGGDPSSIEPVEFKKLPVFQQRALLISAAAREQLTPSKRTYWFKLRDKRYVGYLRHEEVGQWRARVKDGYRYVYLNIGFADEGPNPKSPKHYSFRDAVRITTRFAEDPESVRRDRKSNPYPAYRLIASPVTKEFTVLNAAILYLSGQEGRSSRGHLANLYTKINRHIIPELGNTLCDELTVPQVRNWFAGLDVGPINRARPHVGIPGGHLFSDDDKEEQLGREAANRVMIILRAMLNFAWREGLISGYERPWARVAAYKISKPKDTQGFSRAECEGLIKHCPGDLRSLVLGALFTGARICELRALKRSAFDFASGLLLIYSPKVRRTRRIILSFEAIDFFEHIGLPLGPEDLLFQKTSGEPWVGSDHAHMFRQACLAAGIERRVVFHDLRHTYASHQIMAGVSPFVVADQLGHRDCTQLFKTYGHVSTAFAEKQIRELTPAYVLGGNSLDAIEERHTRIVEHRAKPRGPMPLHIWVGQVADWSKPVI